jgi:hypothetical protein
MTDGKAQEVAATLSQNLFLFRKGRGASARTQKQQQQKTTKIQVLSRFLLYYFTCAFRSSYFFYLYNLYK